MQPQRHKPPRTILRASMTVDNSQVIVLKANAAPIAIPFDHERGSRAADESNACYFDKVRAIPSLDRRTPERASEITRRPCYVQVKGLQHTQKHHGVLRERENIACMRGCWITDHAHALIGLFVLPCLGRERDREADQKVGH